MKNVFGLPQDLINMVSLVISESTIVDDAKNTARCWYNSKRKDGTNKKLPPYKEATENPYQTGSKEYMLWQNAFDAEEKLITKKTHDDYKLGFNK